MDHDAMIRHIPDALREVLQTPVDFGADRGGPSRVDLVARTGGHAFVIDYRGSATADQVGGAIRKLKQYLAGNPSVLPMVVVPYMGDVGKELCRAEGISWMDLSGNASISAPCLRVRLEGKPNRFRRAGRPVNLFAPRSSRVARALLLSPERIFIQSELAEAASLHWGDVSRLVRRYEEAGFIRRECEGRRCHVRLASYDLLLDTWYRAYDFSVHPIRRGHVPAQSRVDLLARVAQEFERRGVRYAATGLSAAWLLEPFATYRLATLYVEDWPPPQVLADLGYRDEPRGSNLWLVRPKDEGVFMGGGATDGIQHVSALQTYLDLKAHPERAAEAAEQLRRHQLARNNANA